jgi:cell division protein FtsI/penicillin-binding protein 2
MLLILLYASMSMVVVQLIRVQFGPFAPVFSSQAEKQTGLIVKILPDRGKIYARDGDLLATNRVMYYVDVELNRLTDQSRKDIPAVLAELLQVERRDLMKQLVVDEEGGGLVRVRLRYPAEDDYALPIILNREAGEILRHFLQDPFGPDLSGLALDPIQQREYPVGNLLGHALGFVNQANEGYFGVEKAYDDWLSGEAVEAVRETIPLEAGRQPDPTAGVNLVLTLDVDIQQMVHDELRKALEWSGAESGQVIITNPRTGEILAMTAIPALDPVDYDEWFDDPEGEISVITPAVAGQFEPGSTFKVLVMAAALNEGVLSPEDEFIDEGEIEVGGHIIRNWDGEAWGPQTMTDCIRNSLNVCFAYIASSKLGAAHLYRTLDAFGIGKLTNVDLAGEVPGKLRMPRDPYWSESDLATNSFGQGVSVTPIQLVAAVGAIANAGELVQPHIVQQVSSPQGVYWPKPKVIGRPIRAETAQTLTEMLILLQRGDEPQDLIPGYRLAGKTGTAQIPSDFGYEARTTIASFIGWGPVEDPQFLIFVRLDRPKISPWGSTVAAPVFKDIAEQLIIHLEIPPTNVLDQIAVEVGGN